MLNKTFEILKMISLSKLTRIIVFSLFVIFLTLGLLESLFLSPEDYIQSDAVMNYPANVRRMGSAALDLAYVAAGRWHGFWGVDLKPWDVAAGLLIALESGVVGVDFSGQPLKPDTAAMIVARHAVLPDLQALILKSLRLTAA